MTTDLVPRSPSHRPLSWSTMIDDLQAELVQFDAEIYIVGGAVRDALLGIDGKDIDITTTGNSVKIARHLANAFDGDVYVMDADRGVARTMITRPDGYYVIDVNAMRGDGLLADLLDRDFTINAMAVDLRADLSQIIDPLGGEADLVHKILRQCADDSLTNDPIRSLRAVRMSVKYQMRLEGETLRAIGRMLEGLIEMPAERGRDEFFKILALPKAHSAVRVLDQLKLLHWLIPETERLKAIPFEQGTLWEVTLRTLEKLAQLMTVISPRRTDSNAAVFDLGMMVMALDVFRGQLQAHLASRWPDERTHEALLLLSVLLLYSVSAEDERAVSDQVTSRGRALRLSMDEIQRLKVIATHHQQPLTMNIDDLTIHRFWHEHGEIGVDICLVGMAVYLGQFPFQPDHDEWVLYLERIRVILHSYYLRYDEVVAPPALLDGEDLIALFDLKPSKQIGELLTAIREAQVTGEIQTKDDAVAFVGRLL